MNITGFDNYYSSPYIKIRISSHKNSKMNSSNVHGRLVLDLLASFAFLLVVLVTIVLMIVWQKKKIKKWNDHAFLKQVSSNFHKELLLPLIEHYNSKFLQEAGERWL